MFNVCTTADMAHIDTIFNSCHTRINMGASIFFTAAMIRAFVAAVKKVLWFSFYKCL
jgi:hypothetical protein